MEYNLNFIIAVWAGLISFISPCVLPLVPAYLANIAGTTAIDVNARSSRLPVLFHSLFFVAGFSLVFIAMGALVGLIGNIIYAYATLFRYVSGAVIILFGLFLIASYKLPWLNYQKRVSINTASTPGYARSVLIGAVFALGWTPCVGPILGSILMMAASSHTVGQGALYLLAYSLGLGVPFILIGLLWGFIMPLWKGINRHLGKITIISGALLIIIGILILTGRLSLLTQFA